MNIPDHKNIKEPIKYFREFIANLPGDRNKLPEDYTPCDLQGFERVMNVGTQFLYVSDVLRRKVIYVSPGIRHMTGYDPADVSFDMIYDNIHPADRREAIIATIDCLEYIYRMKITRPGQITFHLNFRFRKQDGTNIVVLRQTSSLKTDEEGNLTQTLSIITDIDHLAKGHGVEAKMTETETGKTLYHRNYSEEQCVFSNREKEIIRLIAKGKRSHEIADGLCISPHTVLTHRRNILSKAELKNTAELLFYSKEHGIL